MSRKSFYEIIDSIGLNPSEEYKRILNMFSYEKSIVVYGSRSMTLQEYINIEHFRKCGFRGTYTDITEMISVIVRGRGPNNMDWDTLYQYFEFLLAVFFDKNVNEDDKISQNDQVKTIIENIITTVKRSNHVLHNIGDKYNPRYVIVENDKTMAQAAEITSESPVSIDIIEYKSNSIKGNLGEKRKLLNEIGNFIEPILRSKKLQNAGYKQLESDAGFLLNNFHVRHNNKEGPKAQDYIVSIDDSKLEEWYDKIYNTLLSVIIIGEEIDVLAELNSLKSSYNWRT